MSRSRGARKRKLSSSGLKTNASTKRVTFKSSDLCTICFDELGSVAKRVETLKCNHSFHLACIKQCRQPVCPGCRADISGPRITGKLLHEMRSRQRSDVMERNEEALREFLASEEPVLLVGSNDWRMGVTWLMNRPELGPIGTDDDDALSGEQRQAIHQGLRELFADAYSCQEIMGLFEDYVDIRSYIPVDHEHSRAFDWFHSQMPYYRRIFRDTVMHQTAHFLFHDLSCEVLRQTAKDALKTLFLETMIVQ